jgi:hypothetical protein
MRGMQTDIDHHVIYALIDFETLSFVSILFFDHQDCPHGKK